jgi:hypothetical protein
MNENMHHFKIYTFNIDTLCSCWDSEKLWPFIFFMVSTTVRKIKAKNNTELSFKKHVFNLIYSTSSISSVLQWSVLTNPHTASSASQYSIWGNWHKSNSFHPTPSTQQMQNLPCPDLNLLEANNNICDYNRTIDFTLLYNLPCSPHVIQTISIVMLLRWVAIMDMSYVKMYSHAKYGHL